MPCCCVFGCSNRSDNRKNKNKVRTFAFPRDIDRRKLWEVKIGRKSWKASDGGRICEVITFPL
jgi:hypothetical protein